MLRGIKLLQASLWIVGLASTAVFAQRPLGIDTSVYCPLTQSEWNAIYASGRVFGWTRSSYGWGGTDGELANHMTRATNAGVIMGVYHFSYPGYSSGNTPTNEANTFISAAGSYINGGYLRPVLDVEYNSGAYMGGLTLSQWCVQFLNYFEQQTGVRPLIYSGQYFARDNLNSTVTPWPYWIAQWPYTPDPQNGSPGITTPWSTWTFWQYAGDVPIPGVTTQQVDLNVFNGTWAGLQAYVIPGGNNPPTITQHPSSQTAGIGGAATFTVAATGSGTLTYQWQKNSVNQANGGHYSGCTTATLTVSSADTNDQASYRCVVSNAYGSTNSNQATLTVVACPPPSLLNGNFEGGNTNGVGANWTSYQRATNPTTVCSIQTASPPTGGGLQYQQIANTTATGGGGVRQVVTGCTAGVTYTIAGWMRTNSTSATAQVKVSSTASTDWATAVNLSPAQSTTSSTWVAFSGTVVATGASMTLWLDGHTGGTGLNKTACFDSVTVSGCSEPPACTPPSMTNGNFETGTAGNPPSGWTTYIQSAKSGAWSIQTVTPPQGTQWQQTQVYNASSFGGIRQNVTGLTSGSVYTISGTYKTNSASATAAVRYNLSGNTDRANSTSLVSTISTSWGTFSADVTASGSSLMLFLDHLNGTSTNKASAFDNIKVVCKP